MPMRLKMRHFLFSGLLLALMAYQNCAQAPQADSTLSSTSSYQAALPFAYKSQVDTIAYMSCSDISASVEPRAYFTFRAGAYRSSSGGITLTDEYRAATQYYSNTDRGRALAESDRNSGALLSLSIRSSSNFQTIWATDATTPGNEIDKFLPPLEGPEIAGPLAAAASGTKINYFPGASDQRLMEASLRFMKYENVANDTRNALDGQTAYLVAGYSVTSDEADTNLRGPAGYSDSGATGALSTSSVYGRGYALSFGVADGMSSGDRRVLVNAREINLETKITDSSATWNCPKAYEFLVVRPEDIVAGNRVTCNTTVDRYTNSTEQSQLDAIRRVLRVEDWFVDVTHRCVVPKRTGDYCYGANLGTRTIQYYTASCTDSATTSCPHFVSVCVRN